MKTLRIAALAVAVSGVFTLGAKAGTDTNNWWDVTFDDKLGLCDLENQTVGRDGAMVVLTNQTIVNDGATVSVQTWDSGIWYTADGDETIVTNGYFPTNTYKAYGSDLCLKLDTQGNDLTWRVDPTNTMADSRTALVDADLYLVGSDSPPDTSDFDASGDVQTAVYLKNETDEDTGETTNSVLCVYARNAGGQNYWQELKGVTLKDNSWASVKVVVDHAKVIDPQNPYPVVQVFVNGVKMTARDGDADYWTAANPGKAQEQGRVSSVAFRGTGAVDNFVGKLVETTYDTFNFTAQVVMDGTNVLATGTAGNVTRTLAAEAGEGKTVAFPSFEFHDQHWDDNAIDPETGEPGAYVVSYALTKIEITDLVNGTTQTFTYGYNRTDGVIVPQTVSPNIVFDTEIGTDEETGEEYEYYSGPFSVSASTAGATEDSTVVKVYFESLPAEGQFKLTATQNVGTAPAEQIFNTNSLAVTEATFTYAQTLTVDGTSYVLSKVVPGTAPAGAITVAYTSPNVVVTVPLTDQIAEGTYNVAAATYVEGTIAEGKLVKLVSDGQGGYDLVVSDPPVAIIVADSGATTNEYATLAAAVEAVEADAATTTTITLLADIDLTGDNANVTIPANKDVTLDLNGHSIAGDNDADITVLGSFTFTDSAEYEEGDTPASLYATAAYATGHDTGLVRVSGSGVFTMAGGVIDAATIANPADYGQFGVVYIDQAVVNVTGGTIKAGWYALSSNGTVTDGTPFSTTVTISGGTLVSTSDYAIYMADAGTVTIYEAEGSTTVVDGAAGAICTRRGSLDIQGGSFSTAGTGDVGSWSDGTGNLSPNVLINVPANYAARYGDTACPVTISGGTFIAATGVDCLALGNTTVGSIAVSGGSFSVVVPDAFCATGYVPVTTPVNGLYTVGHGAVQITIADTVRTFGSIADAQAAAATAEIADPVFTIIDELSAETVTLAYGDTLKIVVAEDGDITDLTVETSATGDAQYAYAVADETDAETGVTTYSVVRTVKTYDIEWIVDGACTTNTWDYGATPSYDASDATVVPTKASTDATNFTFKAWNPEVVAVTGFASYTATWTETAHTYAITFQTNGVDYATVDAEWHATGYAPADPAAPEGKVFKGWALSTAPTTVLDTLPEVSGAATYVAVFEDDVIEPPEVDVGDNLLANDGAPMEFAADGKCTVRFRAPATGVYVLLSSTTVNGTYVADEAASATKTVTDLEDNLVELTEGTAGTTKFFKIGWSAE